MYQALYRKWRPRDFSDVVGQEHITETLRQQVAAGRLSHAYLFVGTRGTGKTTCAKILAKAANCEHPVDGNPCNVCPSCLGIDNGSILDVEELDAASNNGVDNIREIRDEAVFSPATVRKRVYIIDEVHMLSTSAFNALLKILEEPPEHLIFILATTEIHKVPATILSRCQRYSFKRIAARDIAHRMAYIAEKENITLLPDAAETLARLADGSMRDGLSLLDQCIWDKPIDLERVLSAIGLAGSENTAKLFDFIMDRRISGALELLDRLYMEGKDVGSVLEELCSLCRDILILKVAPENGEGLMSGAFPMDVLKSASKIQTEKLLYMVKTIQESLCDIDRSSNRKISAEMCLMQLCNERLSSDISALSARVARLESGAVPSAVQLPPAIPQNQETVLKRQTEPFEKPIPEAEPTDLPPWGDVPLKKSDKTADIPKQPLQRSLDIPEPAVKLPQKPAAQTPILQTSDFQSSGNLWKDVLSIAEKQIDIAPFSFLSDRVQAEGELFGNTLTVSTKNPVAKMMIDVEPVTTALKHAAEQVAGQPVTVKITDYVAKPVQPSDKLAELRKFENIKFK